MKLGMNPFTRSLIQETIYAKKKQIELRGNILIWIIFILL